jgi:hypothetical protein
LLGSNNREKSRNGKSNPDYPLSLKGSTEAFYTLTHSCDSGSDDFFEEVIDVIVGVIGSR